MKTRVLFLALATIALLPASSLAVNLVANPGFELYDTTKSPSGGTGYYTYLTGSTGVTSWTVGLVSVDLVLASTYPGLVHSGAAALDLAGSPGPGSVTQTLATTGGQSYSVSVWAMGTDTTNQQFVMSFAGHTQTFTTTSTYAQYGFTFTAPTASSVLTISTQATNTTNGNDMIDDVSVQAVPEPASMAALGLGIVALIRRKRRAEPARNLGFPDR